MSSVTILQVKPGSLVMMLLALIAGHCFGVAPLFLHTCGQLPYHDRLGATFVLSDVTLRKPGPALSRIPKLPDLGTQQGRAGTKNCSGYIILFKWSPLRQSKRIRCMFPFVSE